MVECVFRHDGTLDKFIGDARHGAVGRADRRRPTTPTTPMAAAIDMMQRARRAERDAGAPTGRRELQIGIGLNFGEAFAGNIGSERRLEFTVIGDTVNTANRLCSAADAGEILITEELRRVLKDPSNLTERPPMELKNKLQPVTIYRVGVG